MKLKWKVQPAPTGRYRSFDHRGWPELLSPGGHLVAMICCSDDYSAKRAKSGEHMLLSVVVYDYHDTTGAGRTAARFKERFKRIEDAKWAAENFFRERPQCLPTE